MNWNIVSAAATATAAIAALIAVWFQARYTRFAVRAQISLQLERDYYYDEIMIERRRVAAKALLEGRMAIEVDDLLNFFDTVGMMVRRGVIDYEVAFHSFGRRALGYWEYSRHRIESARMENDSSGKTWNDFDYLIIRLKRTLPRNGWQAPFDNDGRVRWRRLMLREARDISALDSDAPMPGSPVPGSPNTGSRPNGRT